jgi:magnesium transporter
VIAHNQNRAMQTLSVMSTIFLPLSFLAGVYGANFDFIP